MSANLKGSFDVYGVLSGELSPMPQLDGQLSVRTTYDVYTGETDIIPKAYQDQILNTANKLVTQNILVHKVPYTETHNDSGVTVYIAKES